MAKAKMTLIEAVNASGALQSFSNSARLGWELSWKVDDIVEALEKHTKRYQSEAQEIMKTYGEPLEGQPGRFRVAPENTDKYGEAVNALEQVEISVDIEPLNFAELSESGAKVQGREMRALRKHFITKGSVNKGQEDKEKELKAKMKKSPKVPAEA